MDASPALTRLGLKLAILTGLLLGLPLLGIVLTRQTLAPYLEFPPLTRFVEHAPFSWGAFFLVGSIWLALFGFVLFLFLRDRRNQPVHEERRGHWPLWGSLALVWLVVWWVLAWNRFPWFDSIQQHTFTPLWVGYILVINAATCKRAGHCLLTDSPAYLLSLFPISALFWWYFEYLNRFVQNWYYVGAADYGPVEYILYASLAFSTVLPAVASTTEWLRTFTDVETNQSHVLTTEPRWRPYAWVALLAACAGLVGIGVWPNLLYPLVWGAPFLLVVSLQVLFNESTLLSRLSGGDWSIVYLPALAALQCGFFWEMWNYFSLAKWVYSIPYVHRFEVFEMPILGYVGYLPFGLECVAVAHMIGGVVRQGRRGQSR